MSSIGKIYMIPTVLSEGSQEKTIPAEINDQITKLNFFAVENIRSARRFIRSINKEKIIDDIDFQIVDKNTKSSSLDKIFDKLFTGEDLGILSEAGCPGIADPGALLIEKAHENGIKVIPLVGPSSIILALMASGMNGQSFTFHGYLPIQEKERRQSIKSIESTIIKNNQTQIFMETPYRNNKLLEDLIKICSPKTKLCIACNITAEDEYIETLTIQDWKKMKVDFHKKPTMFVLGK